MESNWVDFKTIKQAVTVGQVLDHYSIKLKKSGKELRGRCPIHQGEGADTFHVSTEKNVFHCFSCQAKGNILDLVAAMEKCSVRDAGLKLQQWFSLAIQGSGSNQRPRRRKKNRRHGSQLARGKSRGEGRAKQASGLSAQGHRLPSSVPGAARD